MLPAIFATLPTREVLVLGATILFGAGLLRGFSGYGFSIAAVPLLCLIMPPTTAVPIALVLQAMISASGLGGAFRECDWRSVRLLAVSAVVLTPLGVFMLTRLPENAVRICISLIVALAVLVLRRGTVPVRMGIGRTIAFGALAGLFNGLAGMPGPPVIAYYLGDAVPSARARASMMVLFFLTSIAALVPLAWAGALTSTVYVMAAAALPIVWLGSTAGAWLFRRSSEFAYRWTGVAVLCATALVTAGKAIASLA